MNTPPPDDQSGDEPPQQPQQPDAPAVWRSEELLAGQREALIRHGNQIYRLRLTRQGKLILHK